MCTSFMTLLNFEKIQNIMILHQRTILNYSYSKISYIPPIRESKTWFISSTYTKKPSRAVWSHFNVMQKQKRRKGWQKFTKRNKIYCHQRYDSENRAKRVIFLLKGKTLRLNSTLYQRLHVTQIFRDTLKSSYTHFRYVRVRCYT